MVEPGLATQEDFKEINEEVKLRDLITPLRYSMHGPNLEPVSVVRSSDFDALRDAYISDVLPDFVGYCGLCHGMVNTGQQFMRVEKGNAFPVLTHIVCEE